MADGAHTGYVFIVTYGRSGSTLLQRALHQIDGALIRGENHNALYALFEACQRLRRTVDAAAEGAADPKHPFYGAGEIDITAFERGVADLFIRTVLKPNPNTRWLGFKEIRAYESLNTFDAYMEALVRLFPGARIIFNTRRAEDVARSSWWAHMRPEAVLMRLESLHQKFSDYAAAHPDHAMIAAYEDYANSVDGFRPIFDFLGEPMPETRIADILSDRLTHK